MTILHYTTEESLFGYSYMYYSYINQYMVTSDTYPISISSHYMYYITNIITLHLPHWDENLSSKVMFKHRGVDGCQGTCIPVHAHRFHPGKEKKILAVTYNNNPSLTIKEHEGGEGVMAFNHLENTEYGPVWEMGNVCTYPAPIPKSIWPVLMAPEIHIQKS